MKKILFSAALVVAFTVSSALAGGSCGGGGCGDKPKDGTKKDGSTNQTHSVKVSF